MVRPGGFVKGCPAKFPGVLSKDLQEIASRGKSVDLDETVTVGDLVRLTL